MKLLAVLLVLGYASQALSAPALPNLSPAMLTVLMDMMQKILLQANMPMKLTKPVPPPPMEPPLPQYMPPQQQPPTQPVPPAPQGNNNVFMNMPTGQTGGAVMGYGMGMNNVLCPPGRTSSDSCKDQKLLAALYFPDNTPRYNWVPPYPWDGSVPDSVKDTAENILRMKVNSRPNRMIYPKEHELLSILGDFKGHYMG